MSTWRWVLGLIVLGLCHGSPRSAMGAPQETDPPAYTDHRKLLVWRDGQGEHPVETPQDWARRRAHILLGIQQAMGPLPDRNQFGPLDVRILQSKEGPDFTWYSLTFATDSGDRVPCYLFIPTRLDGRRVPGILALHQTTPLGKKETAGEGPDQNKRYGLELARRGYVVLMPDYPSFGDYTYDFHADPYVSGSMKGIVNHMRAVDVLVSRAEVDPQQIGAVGHSLGGHNAMFVGVFDERIKAIVSSCGWTPFHHYYGGKLEGWTSDRYIPRIRDQYELDPDKVPFDMYEIVAGLAPRAFLSISPLHDSNFDVTGVRLVMDEARRVYELLGAADRLQVRYPDCEHDFPLVERQAAYQFLDKQLNHSPRGTRKGNPSRPLNDRNARRPATGIPGDSSLGRDYLSQWTPPPQADSKFPYEKETDADWVDDRFQRMDIGAMQHASIQSSSCGMIPKGIGVRLGPDRDAALLFDMEHCVVRAYWRGAFLQLPSTRFGLLEMPSVAEREVLSLTQSANTKPDIQFHGEYVYGDRIVLHYTLPHGTVWESPRFFTRDGSSVWQRSMEVATTSGPVSLLVCDGTLETRGMERAADGTPWKVVQVGRMAGIRSEETGSQGSPDERSCGPDRIYLAARGEEIEWTCSAGPVPATSLQVGWSRGIRRPVEILVVHSASAVAPNWASLLEQAAPRGDHTQGLSRWMQGGPRRWGEPLVTQGALGEPQGPFAVDTLPLPHDNPFHALLFASGLDFASGGSAYLCTAHGDVWKVDGIDELLDRLQWTRFATGLYQPLGLRIVDDAVYVLGRDRITRLHDLNGDDEADWYETFNDDLREFGQPHAYAMSLETDARGNFYFIKSGDDPPHGGTMLRVSRDGKQLQEMATGYRHANGLGIGPGGEITSADNEGNWVPATRIDRVRPGGFYGYLPTHRRVVPPATYDPPLCWLPRWLDNSAGGQVWIDSPNWRELQGKMLHLSFGRCTANLVLQQQIGDQWQGGALQLPLPPFHSGVMRGRISARDGHLYLCGLDGWQTAARQDGCLQRVRVTGEPFQFPVGLAVEPRGVRLDFAVPLAPDIVADLSRYRVEQWQYRWTETYGSPHYSIADPEREGHDQVPVTHVALSPTGHSLHLDIPGIAPVMQMHLQANLRSVSGDPVTVDLCHTIHRIPPDLEGSDSPSEGTEATGRAMANPFRLENLMAWCIVPFDQQRRSPQQRAEMLNRLGIRRLAYDYRAEHITTFAEEIEACWDHGIELTAWWFPSQYDAEARQILEILAAHQVHPQLWVTGGGEPTRDPKEQSQRVASEAARILPIAEAAARIGCTVGLYNHGGWFGEPENQIEIIRRLKMNNVGMVYNLHHGHSHLDRFPQLIRKMLPYLLAININGMEADGEQSGRKILPIGAGSLDESLLKTVRDSGFQGPIGILNHTDHDAEARLLDNLDGLTWLGRRWEGQTEVPPPAYRTWPD